MYKNEGERKKGRKKEEKWSQNLEIKKKKFIVPIKNDWLICL